jgi:penicillin-binding protein 1A
VLEVREREARLAWLERPDPRGAAQPRTGTVHLDELGWARPVLAGGRLGGQPRRIGEVLAAGDVVLVEPAAATPPQGRSPGRPERLLLRQMPAVEGAVVAMDPNTGRVLAMAGGWSFERSWFNRATQAMRQPGSSFKPFVYLAALEMGIPPNQRLLDAPVEVQIGNQVWRPANYSGNFNGWVTMRYAMERSLNLVTVRLAQEVGMERVSDVAGRFGVITAMPRYLAMSLGAGETTVVRQAAAYASFANGGYAVTPVFIDSVQDRLGRVVWRADARICDRCAAGPEGPPPELPDARRSITDPIAAFQMTSLLQGAVQRGTGARAGQGLGRPVAGKTGTSNDYLDNWFVGYTPDLVVAVWVGFDEPRSLGEGETGGTNAAPIFREVVAAALQGSPPVPFRAPPGVAFVRIQTDSGATITEAFRPGTENSARPPLDGFGAEAAISRGSAVAVDSNLGGLY